MKFEVICAWCGKFLGLKDAKGVDTTHNNISHSICEVCLERELSAEFPEK